MRKIEQRKKSQKTSSKHLKINKSSKNIEENSFIDISDYQNLNFSLNSSLDKSSLILLEHFEDLKKLLKSQEKMIKKYQDETVFDDAKNIKKAFLKLEKENFTNSGSDKLIEKSHELEEYNDFTSLNSLDMKSLRSESIIKPLDKITAIFFRRDKLKKLYFSEKIMILSHLNSLNL